MRGDLFSSRRFCAWSFGLALLGLHACAPVEEALRSKTWTNSVGMEFVRVPAGDFRMGSDTETAHLNEGPVTAVRIDRAFYMGRYEVTQGQWEAVMGSNPSRFRHCGTDCPVESVSWHDIKEFLGKLNEAESGGGYEYRLPTEAEWEYAARGGTQSDTVLGDLTVLGRRNAPLLDTIAWYSGNSGTDYQGAADCSSWDEAQNAYERCGPHPVGGKAANPYGLHDMLGNVWEWVEDRYAEYPGGSVHDPVGPETGLYRVRRGGAWNGAAVQCRAPFRMGYLPEERKRNLGFRILRTDD